MIRHCVMLRLRRNADLQALGEVCAELKQLVDQLEGCSGFIAGPNRDLEGKSVGFPYGFTFDAISPEALSVYADHPTHKALGGRLVQQCQDGATGIMVFDLDIAE